MPSYFDKGYAVRRPSWHGEETLLQEFPANWDEARLRAGLTWEPIAVPAFGFAGIGTDGKVSYDPTLSIAGSYSRLDEYNRIVRNDNGFLLAVTRDSRPVINHQEMGEAIEMVTDIKVMSGDADNVHIDTMGSVQDGRKVYATLIVDEPFTIFGDDSPNYPMLTATNAHDDGAFRIGASNVRVVCANTFAAAEAEQDGHKRYWSFRHTANWKEQIPVARAALKGVREEAKEYKVVMDGLAHLTISKAQTEVFLQRYFSLPEFGATTRVTNNALAARQAIRATLASPTCEGIAHTAYGLVQATGEYLDHLRRTQGNKRDSLVQRQIITTNQGKNLAVRLAREVALAGV